IKNLPLRHTVLFGGMNMDKQTADLRAGCEIVVATVGRLLDHVKQKNIHLNKVEIVVLDEADRMLDMGFIDDIETIVEATPSDRQTLLFSATWDGAVGKLARKLTKDPEIIEVERVDDQGKIEEQLLYCDDMRHKNRLLDHILRDANIDQCVIFTSTKAMTEVIADE
ncbi:DEAD/DEAH box helicase, partial [Klebsiella pneumoniae]|nr:DEAD/DEAH box helicase [Klebsiella pneumoniae]